MDAAMLASEIPEVAIGFPFSEKPRRVLDSLSPRSSQTPNGVLE
jgi:hypothetical protein